MVIHLLAIQSLLIVILILAIQNLLILPIQNILTLAIQNLLTLDIQNLLILAIQNLHILAIQSLLLVIHPMAIPLILPLVGLNNLLLDGLHILHKKRNILMVGLNLLLVILTILLLVGLHILHMKRKRKRSWRMSLTTTGILHTITTTLITILTTLPTTPPTPLHQSQRRVPRCAISPPTQTAPASTQLPSPKMEEATVTWAPSNLTYRSGVMWTLTTVILRKFAQMQRKVAQRRGIIGPDLHALLNKL